MKSLLKAAVFQCSVWGLAAYLDVSVWPMLLAYFIGLFSRMVEEDIRKGGVA